MNLDAVSSGLCFWVSMCLYGVFIVTSPRLTAWGNLPEFVRKGVFTVGVMFMWRGANLSALSGTTEGAGHINAEGFLTLISVTYTLTALGVWLLQRKYGPGVLRKILWFEEFATHRPDLVPSVVAEAAILEHAAGVAKPGATVEDYVRTLERTAPPPPLDK